MRHRVVNAFVVVPAVALAVGLLVWFGMVPGGVVTHRGFQVTWVVSTLTSWVLTVLGAAGMTKGWMWLARAGGLLAVGVALAVGLAGVLQGSVVAFCAFLALTMAASALAIAASRSGTRAHRAFCRGFAACTCLSVALTLMAGAPVTGTPLVRVMWWAATEWGNAAGWNGASYLGSVSLILTWFFAVTGGWLSAKCAGSGRADRTA
jgi:hypothetical protein